MRRRTASGQAYKPNRLVRFRRWHRKAWAPTASAGTRPSRSSPAFRPPRSPRSSPSSSAASWARRSMATSRWRSRSARCRRSSPTWASRARPRASWPSAATTAPPSRRCWATRCGSRRSPRSRSRSCCSPWRGRSPTPSTPPARSGRCAGSRSPCSPRASSCSCSRPSRRSGGSRSTCASSRIESVVEGSSIVVLVLLGAGATGAAFGRAIGYTVGVGIALGYVWRVVGRPRPGAGDVSGLRVREILAYSGALLIVDALFRAFAQIDVLLIGADPGRRPRDRPVRPADAARLVPALPGRRGLDGGRAAAGAQPRTRSPRSRPSSDAMRWITALQGIFLAPIIVWAEPIMTTLLGPKYKRVRRRAAGAGAVRARVRAGAARLAGGQLPGRGAQRACRSRSPPWASTSSGT